MSCDLEIASESERYWENTYYNKCNNLCGLVKFVQKPKYSGNAAILTILSSAISSFVVFGLLAHV